MESRDKSTGRTHETGTADDPDFPVCEESHKDLPATCRLVRRPVVLQWLVNSVSLALCKFADRESRRVMKQEAVYNHSLSRESLLKSWLQYH